MSERPLSAMLGELGVLRLEEYKKYFRPALEMKLARIEQEICQSDVGAERKRGERDALMAILGREKELSNIVGAMESRGTA